MTTSEKIPYQQEAFNEKHGQARAREQLGDNPRRTAFVKKAEVEGQAAEQAEGEAKNNVESAAAKPAGDSEQAGVTASSLAVRSNIVGSWEL